IVKVPVFAFVGTTTVSFEPETTLNFAGTPLKVTDVVPAKFSPVTVTVTPGFAAFGATFVICGVAALIGRKPSLTKSAWPLLLSTLLTNACAAAWFELFETIASEQVIFGCA